MEDAVPALLITREICEHVNVFHTMTDLFNAYIALTMLGWADTPRQVQEIQLAWRREAAVLLQLVSLWQFKLGPRGSTISRRHAA